MSTTENLKLRAEKKVFIEKTVHINVHTKLVHELELLETKYEFSQ